MRLICWNLNKRRAVDRQVEALSGRAPDLIALQEVTARNLPLLRDHLIQAGFAHVAASEHQPGSPRGHVIIASRWPLQPLALDWPRAYSPESAVATQVETPWGALECYAVHVPTGGVRGSVKDEFLETLYARLACPCATHRLLCGDFNAPQKELGDGTLITFGQWPRSGGSYQIRRGWERKDQAERGVLTGLASFDLRDVYRQINGFSVQEYSWVAKNRGRAFGFRLDHVLASASLAAQECRYLSEWREANLSDHAPIEAVFAPKRRDL